MGMNQVEQQIIAVLEENIRNILDFPRPGVQFKDITTLLQNKGTLELTSSMLAEDVPIEILLSL